MDIAIGCRFARPAVQAVLLGLPCLVLSCLLPPAAGAATLTTFTDRTDFQTIVPRWRNATPQTFSTFEGASTTIGEVTFSAAPGSELNIAEWTDVFPGNEIALNGTENLDILMANRVFAMGIDFRDAPANEPGGGATPSIFVVTLLNQGSEVGQFPVSVPNSPEVTFIGVLSDEPFDRLQIRETSSADENEFFHWVYVGQYSPGVPGTNTVYGSNLCVGFDCVNGEAFPHSPVKLKENNLRIRFIDTSVGDVLGQSWNVEANSARNGGPSYLAFQVKSVEVDNVWLSDGSAPLYDCTVMTNQFTMPPIVGTTPDGEPVLSPTSWDFQTGLWSCETVPDYTVHPMLQLGNASTGVRMGHNSRASVDVISLGREGLLRRVRYVASALAGTDLLTVQELDEFDLLGPQRSRQSALSARLDLVEQSLDGIESTLTLYESDSDGDGLSYYREVFVHGTDPTRSDTDGDGVLDPVEIEQGMDPRDPCDSDAGICRSTILRLIVPTLDRP